jgi:plastocyanin
MGQEETNTMKKLLIPLLFASVILAACSGSDQSAPQVITMDTNNMKFLPATVEVRAGLGQTHLNQ